MDKKQELVCACLNIFVDKGLIDLSMRELGKALNRNAAGFYYYFKSRDELVVACAEAASARMEGELVGAVLKDLRHPDRLTVRLRARAEAVRPLMHFFVAVCASRRYRELVRPIPLRLSAWHSRCTDELAKAYNCRPEEIAPYVHMLIETVLGYLLFGQVDSAALQVELACNAMTVFLKNREGSDQPA